MSGAARAEVLSPSRWMGAAVTRVEDPRLLRGGGRYLDDLRVPGMLHAAFVRSPHAHARIAAVGTAAALAAPGVAAVLCGRDLGAVVPLAPRLDAPGFAPTAWAALAPERARFPGEPVAVVAAESAYAAVDAAELVSVDYEPLPALPGLDAALAPGAPRLHEAVDGNVLLRGEHSHGDVDAAFARASHVIGETFSCGRVSASPLEPRGMLAHWEADALTVWVGTQIPFVLRRALARAFALHESFVRVVVPDTGGGFGQKMHVLAEDLAVVALARAAGRPVKWVETRRENLQSASHAREQRVALELAADAEGCLLALRARVWGDSGAYHVHPLTAALEPLGAAGIIPGPYRVPAYAFEALGVATTKPPIGAYRGVGMTVGVFAMERALDLLAERVGVDAAEIRRRNLLRPDEYPYRSAAGFTYDSGDFPAALDRALALSGHAERRAAQAEARRQGRLVGIGIACYTESTGIGAETFRHRGMVEMPGPEAASVRMEPDGSVAVRVSFPSQGQGHATTVAQLVADRLGVGLDQVRLVQPDTASAPAGSGTFGSRGAVAQLATVDRGAAALRARLLAIAAHQLEASPADLVLDDGHLAVRGLPERRLAIAKLARLAHYPPPGGLPEGVPPGLEATASHDLPGPAFSGAVHVAEVEVDPATGRVAVQRYAVVEDCGPVINPLIVEGQVHGAVAQGIGEALSERLVYDGESGQLLTGTFMDYGLPLAADLPSFAIDHLGTPSPLTAGGVKGVGEGGTVGAPAAIAGAVADAVRPLGTRIAAIPILAEHLARPLGP